MVVRAFAVDDGRRLTDAERDGGRAAFDIPTGEAAVCLAGGWWPYKDIGVIDAALALLKEPLHLVVTGIPLDEAVLARWHDLLNIRLHTVPGPVSESVLRLVYATADAALVTRRPGVGKESGLVMDAARLGVPLVVSDHDPALTSRLSGRPWALTFTASSPDALAEALHSVIRQPPERPGPEAPHLLGCGRPPRRPPSSPAPSPQCVRRSPHAEHPSRADRRRRPRRTPLLAAWVRHYRRLGVERFLIAFHFPEHVPDQQRHELQAASRELRIIPTGTSTGPWHEHTNTQLREALRHRAGPGWHLLADVDEFQQYPAPLSEVIAQAENTGHQVVGGLMLDRIAASGRLTSWRPECGLDLAYPLGGHLTHRLLHGDPVRSFSPAMMSPWRAATTGPRTASGCRTHLRGSPLQVALRRPGRPSPPGPALLDRHLAGTDPGRAP
ncbi:glycosyltransferase family 2 protein [Streptomyces sp. M10(2022)]